MAVNKKNIMTRYFFVVLVMGLIGVAIIVKGTVIMFAERQYWQDVAVCGRRIHGEAHRGNILFIDGKLAASLCLEVPFYSDFKSSGEKKDTMLMNHLGRKFSEDCTGYSLTAKAPPNFL